MTRELKIEDAYDALNAAIQRIELANKEGNPILSAWLPDAKRALSELRANQIVAHHLAIDAARYKVARRLNPHEWQALHARNLIVGQFFDSMIDELRQLPNDQISPKIQEWEAESCARMTKK